MEEQGPVSVGSLIPGATLAAKLQGNGFELTTWAGGTTYYLPPGFAVRQVSPSAMAVATGAWLFPAPDVTGTPRVWVNTAGQVVSKSCTGPYGEELGLFSEPSLTGIGFAGYVSDHATTGLFYTRNRYLGAQGRFFSVDPSGSLNLHDSRTFNQFAYVSQNPLIYTDAEGLSIEVTNEPETALALLREGLSPGSRQYLLLSSDRKQIASSNLKRLRSDGDFGRALSLLIANTRQSVAITIEHNSFLNTLFGTNNSESGAFTYGPHGSKNFHFGDDVHIYLNPDAFPQWVGDLEESAARALTHEIGHSMYAFVAGLEDARGKYGAVDSYGFQDLSYESYPMYFENLIWGVPGDKSTYRHCYKWRTPASSNPDWHQPDKFPGPAF